ncbi:MAG: hypothetical protein ABIC68_08795 [Candidatus Omnitrophota bacterium]
MRCRHPLMLCVVIFFCVCLLTGCETLRKKFTRKRKTIDKQENVVIVPRDYDEHPFPPDVLYKQYFAYWKAWNQELIQSLSDQESYKRIMSSSQQAVSNLKKMSSYLVDEKAAKLNVYVEKLEKIDTEIQQAHNLPSERMRTFRYKVSRVYSCVNREFDYTKIKNDLKQ